MVDKKAVGKMARRKGSNFELRVAKKLSEWSGLELRRTPLSGGWGGATTMGDIVPIAPDKKDPDYRAKYAAFQKWCLSVECKAQEGWSFDSFAYSHSIGTNKLIAYIRQAMQAATIGRSPSGGALIPAVIAKRNRRIPVVFFPELYCGPITRKVKPRLLIPVDGVLYACYLLPEFLSEITFSEFVDSVEKKQNRNGVIK